MFENTHEMRVTHRIESPPCPVVAAGGKIQAAGVNCSVHCLGNRSITKSGPLMVGRDTQIEQTTQPVSADA